ncbi:hypothetical protein VQ03_05405 [Methylobacterium tarhaniae]|uniref:Helix-turn-helix domain-containing protein n=1 Tax=Methylobacterium tarhaniae TaxID=1187852 RepID=A0A0J6VXJ5_9HYPH|nr:helix-turn-helix domain-containing protein [Methylobacterium tarhaniae]KMO44016.1 hypothetical protein VQ03_05405 [Methylobacterium tarhaniae]
MRTEKMFPPGEQPMKTREAARRLGVSESFLNKARAARTGPAAYVFGRCVAYRVADVEAYAAAHRIEPVVAAALARDERGGVMPDLSVEPVTPRQLAALRKVLPAHVQPILDAITATGCGFLIVTQHVGAFDPPTVPLFVALIGDDTVPALGPAAFDECSLGALLRACAGVSIVSCEPPIAAYVRCAELAR